MIARTRLTTDRVFESNATIGPQTLASAHVRVYTPRYEALVVRHEH